MNTKCILERQYTYTMADEGLQRVSTTETQQAEAAAFADQINKFLRHDEDLKQRGMIPITEPTPMV